MDGSFLGRTYLSKMADSEFELNIITCSQLDVQVFLSQCAANIGCRAFDHFESMLDLFVLNLSFINGTANMVNKNKLQIKIENCSLCTI